MKKITVIIITIIISLALIGCNTNTSDALKFKQEYEKLNGETNSQGKKYREITIDEDNPFVYSTPTEIIDKIKKEETFSMSLT